MPDLDPALVDKATRALMENCDMEDLGDVTLCHSHRSHVVDGICVISKGSAELVLLAVVDDLRPPPAPPPFDLAELNFGRGWLIWCDSCNARTQRFPTTDHAEALQAAAEAGWAYVRPADLNLCPDCTATATVE